MLSDLAGMFGETTLGDIGGPGFADAYGDMTIGDLLALLIQLFPDVTLGDLLAGMLPVRAAVGRHRPRGATALKQAVAAPGEMSRALRRHDQQHAAVGSGRIDLSVPTATPCYPPPSSSSRHRSRLHRADRHPEPTIAPDDRPGRTLAAMTITPPVGSSRIVFRAIPPLELGAHGPFEIDLTRRSDFWELGTGTGTT